MARLLYNAGPFAAPAAPAPAAKPSPVVAPAPAPARAAPAPVYTLEALSSASAPAKSKPPPASTATQAPSASQLLAELRGQPVSPEVAQVQSKQLGASYAVAAAEQAKGAPLSSAQSSAAAHAGAAAVAPGTGLTPEGVKAAQAAGTQSIVGAAGESPADKFLAGAVPLSGMAALDALIAACDLYGIDAEAASSVGEHEGFGGGIGDLGEAYGPFQEHLTDGRIAAIAGLPPYDERVQAWAWSAAGIKHAVEGMATGSPSARGLTGRAAIHAIVYGFERPKDEPGEETKADATYDELVKLGAGWRAAVAAKMLGPGLPGTTASPYENIGIVPAAQVTGPKNAFHGLMVTVSSALPALGARARTVGRDLPGALASR